jgi:hypothetical protein
MSDIGVKRFPAGYDQKNRAQHNKSVPAVVDEKLESMERINRRQDAGFLEDLAASEGADGEKPQNGNRPKDFPDSRGAFGLEKEKRDQNRDRYRHHIGSKRGVATCNPSTALKTEIAGVIIPSA